MFKRTLLLLLILSTPCGAALAADETISTGSSQPVTDALPIEQMIQAYATRNHKRVIVDPRVRAQVITYGIDANKLSYADFQAILALNGFCAITDSAGTIRVLPDANLRQQEVPILTAPKGDYADTDIVARIISVAHLDAAQLVPPLRPLLPQYAHLVAIPASNSLLVVARYSNVRMVESLVRDLDKAALAKPAGKATAEEVPRSGD
jgi:general secretion pathway protein D